MSWRNKKRIQKHKPLSEINVTPFVDVMLVLLVVFMVTAPLLTVGFEVTLPKTKAQSLKPKQDPIILTMDRGGDIYVQKQKLDLSKLSMKLKAITQTNYKTTIYIRGDTRVNYGRVMKLMGQITAAGFQNVALVTESN